MGMLNIPSETDGLFHWQKEGWQSCCVAVSGLGELHRRGGRWWWQIDGEYYMMCMVFRVKVGEFCKTRKGRHKREMTGEAGKQKTKNYGTQYSRVVPHHSTDCAITSLTSEIGRDPVLSSVYGRNSNIEPSASVIFE